MRMIYIHKSLNAKLEGWDGNVHNVETKNILATVDFATDGHLLFLEALLEENVFSEILVIIESARQPGRLKIGNINIIVIPAIKPYMKSFRKDDVLYWRGGYDWWWALLDKLPGNWHLYYGAGTPRAGWPQWDVILWEGEQSITKRGKLYIPWSKPVNTDIFNFKPGNTPYDVMTSPSKIFDIKQQYKTIDAMKAYQKRYGKVLSVIMPGAYRSSRETSRVNRMIIAEKLPVYRPGYVPRDELAVLYNKTKLMTHHASGLNDRCVLEAMMCGVPLLSLSEGGGRYPKWVKTMRVLAKGADPDNLAQAIHHMLNNLPDREEAAKAAAKHNSITPTVESFKKLVPLLRQPKNRALLVKEYLA
jgi:glycosyltransferase involved in cell wall biosynthesis